jgi:hypothetical protein
VAFLFETFCQVRGCLKRKRVKKRASVFVFKDESEAQRQPLNFPTQWENFGGSLFLLSLLLPVVCTHTTRAKRFRKKQRDFFTRQTRSISSNSRRRENEREREEKRREKEHKSREIESRPITGAAPFHLSS